MQPALIQVTEVVAPNERRTVQRARAGDIAAFDLIVSARLSRVYRLASAILGDEAAASDATQNALVAVWRELPRLRDLRGFDAWFDRILLGECRMQIRRLAGAPEAAARASGDTAPERRAAAHDAATLDRIEILDLLEDAFQKLDAEDRSLVVLRYLDDRSPAEIAAVLHMPVGTAKWRLHEARQALQRALEAAG